MTEPQPPHLARISHRDEKIFGELSEGRGFTGCGNTVPFWYLGRSFGVRQLAAALLPASLLAGICAFGSKTREQARGEESGSKLPHSKASLRMPAQVVRRAGHENNK